MRLARIPKAATAPLSTRSSDTFPPVALVAQTQSGRRLAYPAGKGSEAIRRTMLPNKRRAK